MMSLTVQVAAEALLGAELRSDLEAVENALDVFQMDFEQRFKRVINWPRWIPTPLNRKRERAIGRMAERLRPGRSS